MTQPRLHRRFAGSLMMLTGASPLFACFCINPVTKPCESYSENDVVFVGLVTRAEPRSLEDFKRMYPDADIEKLHSAGSLQRHVTIRVIEGFQGIQEPEVEFTTDFDSCSVQFQEHKTYLIHGWRDQNSHQIQIQTSACGGTDDVESAESQERLRYLRGVKAGTIQSQVFGFVTADPSDMELQIRASKPAPGIVVALRSAGKSWQAVTDPKGEYELTGLTPGSYEISAVLPNLPSETPRPVELRAGACSRQSFLATAVGQISGRLLDSDGKPVSRILVEIEAIPPTEQPHPFSQDFTDDNGEFRYDSLEAGQYLLGVNLMTPPKKGVPLLRSYYPGVTDRLAAQSLKLDAGQKIENLEFHLPSRMTEVTFSGNVVWPDGSPAEAEVRLMDLDYPMPSSQFDAAETKADGRFSLIGLKGRPYSLYAHVSNGDQHIHSPLVDLQSADGEPIRLVLSEDEPDTDCAICKRFTNNW